MKLTLALALMFISLQGRADDATALANGNPDETATTEKAHPDLLRLKKALTRKQADRKDGRLKPGQYQEWEGKFRIFLDATMARVPPSPDNAAGHAGIVALLGESEQARTTLDRALEQYPESPVLLRTKGQILYEQKDYPSAAQNSLLAWEKSGHADRSAWTLYQMSKDRSTSSGAGPSPSPGALSPSQGRTSASASGPSEPYKLAVKNRTTPGEVPALMNAETSKEPPPRHSPLLPILIVTGTGLTALGAYKVSKPRSTRTAEDGLDSAPKVTLEQSRDNYLKSAAFFGATLVALATWEFGPGALAAARTVFTSVGTTGPMMQLATAGAGAGGAITNGGGVAADQALVTGGVKASAATAALVRIGKTAYDHVSYSKSSDDGNDRLRGRDSKRQHDRSGKLSDKDFRRWFHRNWKSPEDPDASREALEEAYQEWLRLGSPKP